MIIYAFCHIDGYGTTDWEEAGRGEFSWVTQYMGDDLDHYQDTFPGGITLMALVKNDYDQATADPDVLDTLRTSADQWIVRRPIRRHAADYLAQRDNAARS